MISYKKLFVTLAERGITKTELRESVGFSTASLARMTRSEYIKMETIDKICEYLDCRIEDVIEYIPNKELDL